MPRYSQILPDIARYGQIWRDIIRYCQILPDIARYCKILQDIARYCKILSVISRWPDMARYGQIWPYTKSHVGHEGFAKDPTCPSGMRDFKKPIRDEGFCQTRLLAWGVPSGDPNTKSSKQIVAYGVKPSREPNTKSSNEIGACGLPSWEQIAKSLIRDGCFFQVHASLKTLRGVGGKRIFRKKPR